MKNPRSVLFHLHELVDQQFLGRYQIVLLFQAVDHPFHLLFPEPDLGQMSAFLLLDFSAIGLSHVGQNGVSVPDWFETVDQFRQRYPENLRALLIVLVEEMGFTFFQPLVGGDGDTENAGDGGLGQAARDPRRPEVLSHQGFIQYLTVVYHQG